MEIYILVDNQPQGPYTRELVAQYLATSHFRSTDLAAYAGSADWKPLSEFVQSWGQASARKLTPASPVAALPAKASKRKPAVLIVSAVLILLAGAAGFLFWKLRAKASWTATKVVTPAEPGWPNSFAELNTWYAEPPEGQNAATYFLKGLDSFQFSEADQKSADLPVLGRGRLPEPGMPLPFRVKASITAVVQQNDAAWARLNQGMGFEHSRYPIDLNQGWDTLLPHLIKIKRAAQFAELKAALSADDHQPEAATDTLLVSLAVAQSLKDEPFLISQLVRDACFAIENASLQNILNSVALSSGDLERLSAAFAKAESSEAIGESFTRAFVEDRVGCLTFCDLPPDKVRDALEKTGIGSSESRPNGVQNLKGQRAFAEESFNHALSMRKEPFPERLRVDEYFVARAGLAKNKGFYLCQMLLSGLEKVTKREAAGLANLRLAQTAIALEQFRQAHAGSYPDSLTALVPTFLREVPVDPFKGQPMRYDKNADGYTLRSTGQDQTRPLFIKVVRTPKI